MTNIKSMKKFTRNESFTMNNGGNRTIYLETESHRIGYFPLSTEDSTYLQTVPYTKGHYRSWPTNDPTCPE